MKEFLKVLITLIVFVAATVGFLIGQQLIAGINLLLVSLGAVVLSAVITAALGWFVHWLAQPDVEEEPEENQDATT